MRLFKRISVTIVEATNAWAQNECADQSRDTTSHMDSTRASQIDGTRSPKRFNVELGKESVARPEC